MATTPLSHRRFLALLGCPTWHAEAACAAFPPRWWFGRAAEVAQARQVCASCPVIDGCLDFALAYQPAGLWAGLTEAERAVIVHEAA